MQTTKNDTSGLSGTSVDVMNGEGSRETIQWKPVGLTITVEKIDHVLADIQAQIERLRRECATLALVRGQLADMEATRRSE